MRNSVHSRSSCDCHWEKAEREMRGTPYGVRALVVSSSWYVAVNRNAAVHCHRTSFFSAPPQVFSQQDSGLAVTREYGLSLLWDECTARRKAGRGLKREYIVEDTYREAFRTPY